ncbi:unnamed protein product [Hydatigera taeniaeformis]|uniref:Uncharacterized protein n=1 Tax=Hydatigena taeniaeformis TaxID=6205 RepID=A0A0R3XDB5_HYDTA|nr:unnamed protein product [Hydatigera taeniaeformis]
MDPTVSHNPLLRFCDFSQPRPPPPPPGDPARRAPPSRLPTGQGCVCKFAPIYANPTHYHMIVLVKGIVAFTTTVLLVDPVVYASIHTSPRWMPQHDRWCICWPKKYCTRF